jgi:hypothetical protein
VKGPLPKSTTTIHLQVLQHRPWRGVYLAVMSAGLGNTPSRGGLVSLSFHRIKFPEPFPITVNL